MSPWLPVYVPNLLVGSSEGLLISAVGKRHAHPADEGTNPLRKKTEQPKEMPRKSQCFSTELISHLPVPGLACD